MSSERGPQLRDGADYEIRDKMALELAKLMEKGLLKTCITCIYFTEASENCRIYSSRPPARVIAYGCKSYAQDDEIPF